MIAAVKQAIAIYAGDLEWARVRPPLVRLTTDQAKLLAAGIKSGRLRDERNEDRLIRNQGKLDFGRRKAKSPW